MTVTRILRRLAALLAGLRPRRGPARPLTRREWEDLDSTEEAG